MEPMSPGDKQYDITEVDVERAGEHEVLAHTESEGVVAGHKVRRLIERSRWKPERAIWAGYDDTARGGWREIPFRFESLQRHQWVSGTTGAGKTTYMHNKAVEHAYSGHGFCNIDPKADGDTVELLRKLPKARLEDVIFIEPGSSDFNRLVGINLLDVPPIEDTVEREKEIENRLENLTAIFDNDDYWGPTMASITESMGRAMLRRNAQISLDPDTDSSEKYSVIDMYFILLTQERREQFAEEVDDPYLKEFLRQIADMSDEDVRPLLKRIKRWVENPIIRKIIARRDSTIDWDTIVDEGKILLVRIPVSSGDVHQMVTLTVLRNLWSAKKRQVRADDREKQPYFIQVDEFEKVANSNLDMDGMLARARSFWLSVTLGTQYPYQIQKDHEEIARAMENNCGTLIAMQTPGSQDSRLLMKRFPEYDGDDLRDTNRHRAWTKIPMEGGEDSPPVNIKMFAPYPPLRPEVDGMRAVKYALETYGAPPLTEQDIQNNLKVGQIGEITAPSPAGHDDLTTDTAKTSGELTLEMVPDETFLEAIFAAQIQYAGDEKPVPQSNVEDALEVRVGDVGFGSEISNHFEKHEYVVVADDRVEGEVAVRLTETGRNKVLSHDTGSSASGGKEDHRWVLRQSYKTFTKLGALTRLPTQEGKELPDGLADLPRDPIEEASTVDDAVEIRNEMIDEYPRLWELSNGRDVSIEAETSTITKPQKTLTNLRKAMEAGHTCVFTCKDGYGDDNPNHGLTYWPTRGERIIYRTNGDRIDHNTIQCVPDTYQNGDRQLYNQDAALKVDSARIVVAKEPADHRSVMWREKGEAIIATSRGGKGQTLCRFENRDLVANPPVATTLHREKRGDEWVVKTGTGEDAEVEASYPTLDALKDNYIDIPQPFIPENEFPRPVEHDDFTFMAFPDADNPNYNEPVVVDRGRETKLSEISFDIDADTDPTTGNDTSTTTDGSAPDTDTDTETAGNTDPSDSPDTTTAASTDTQAASTTDQPPTNESSTTPDETSPDSSENGDTTPTPEINILPHELADELPIDVATATVNGWATSPSDPDTESEAWKHICLYLADEYPEAADAVESPSDLSTLLGNGGAQSNRTQTTNTQQKSSDPTDETGFTF